ncbi:MAG: hypothetical protein LRZ98_02095 [Candidatus Pacebacteria bacterium]|nr:hypothetical protein [Candidatus Paceibacterota bacterium]
MVNFKQAQHIHKLKKLRLESEENMVQVYAHKSNLRYIDLSMVPINTDALRIIPEERARSIKMAVFDMVDRHLHVAIISPLPVLIQEELRRLREKKYTMDIYMVSNRSLNKA